MKTIARHRSHSVAFKRQVAQEYLSGETLHGLAILDAWSRRVVGYALGRSIDACLTLAALRAAIERHRD